MDSLDTSLAIIDAQGIIVLTNRAWKAFAKRNPCIDGSPVRHTEIGTNYLELCQRAKGQGAEGAVEAYRGLSDVLLAKRATFSLDYPCHSPTKRRWFSMVVKGAGKGVRRIAVIIHTDITAQREAEIESESKQRELGIALANLQRFAGQLQFTLRSEHNRDKQTPNTLRASAQTQHGLDQLDHDPMPILSKREMEIFLAIAHGERNSDTATRLGLSTKSVSTYRTRVMDKLATTTDAQVVGLAIRYDLL